MHYVNSYKELRAITAPVGLDVLIPMEAISVQGCNQIYCPHCGCSVIGNIPQNLHDIVRCIRCGKEFYFSLSKKGKGA